VTLVVKRVVDPMPRRLAILLFLLALIAPNEFMLAGRMTAFIGVVHLPAHLGCVAG